MTTRTSSRVITATLTSGALLGAACGGSELGGSDRDDGPTGARLTIVGDQTVNLDARATVDLEVRYHDPEGAPLAGAVEVTLEGDRVGDASLNSKSVLTNEDGVATVTLDTGDLGDLAFQVQATSAEAEPVSWDVSVKPLPPLDPNGSYAVNSQLNVASGLPGRTGRAVDLVIDVTSDPADPTLWLMEELVQYLPDWLQFDPPHAVALAINELLLDSAPSEFIPRLRDLGQDFGDIAQNFGLVSQLEISGEKGARTATHTLTGIEVHYSGDSYQTSFEELGLSEVSTSDVGVTLTEDESELFVDQHELPVEYGTLLVFALEEVLLKDVGGDLETFFKQAFDCSFVADELIARISILPSFAHGTIVEACETAIGYGAGRLRERLLEIDEAGVAIRVSGDGVPVDEDGDRRIDRLEDGHWAGEVRVGDQASRLIREDNTFSGQRGGAN